jgi:hypothetical protein
MKWFGLAGVVVLLMTASCGTDGAEKPSPTQATAKPSAPVNVTASIRPGAADLDVVFGAAGAGMTIQVWGVDGLKVTGGSALISAPSVRSGETLKVPVLYDAPATESTLAIEVSGTFGGREQAKVQSFTINSGSPRNDSPSGESEVDKDGRRVKVMKAQ